MQDCTRLAGIHDEIMRMPMAYNSLIGDMGSSSVRRSETAHPAGAARLYRRPQILFIDEGTSHLDARLEERVNAAIQGLRLTRVSVAHRPYQTLASADRVLQFRDGVLRGEPPISVRTRCGVMRCPVGEHKDVWGAGVTRLQRLVA